MNWNQDQDWIAEEESKKDKRIRSWIKWCKRVPDDAFVDANVSEEITGKVSWLGYHDFLSINGGTSTLNMGREVDEPTEHRKEYNKKYMRERRDAKKRKQRHKIYSKRNNVSSSEDGS